MDQSISRQSGFEEDRAGSCSKARHCGANGRLWRGESRRRYENVARKEDCRFEGTLSRTATSEGACKNVDPGPTRSSKGYTGWSEREKRDWLHAARHPGPRFTAKTSQRSAIANIASGTHSEASWPPRF